MWCFSCIVLLKLLLQNYFSNHPPTCRSRSKEYFTFFKFMHDENCYLCPSSADSFEVRLYMTVIMLLLVMLHNPFVSSSWIIMIIINRNNLWLLTGFVSTCSVFAVFICRLKVLFLSHTLMDVGDVLGYPGNNAAFLQFPPRQGCYGDPGSTGEER